MKIYSSSSSISLTDFMGKDAWVLCNNFWGDVYVRVVSPRTETNYIVNQISVKDLNYLQDPQVEESEILHDITDVDNVDITKFNIIQPLTVKSTEELFPNLQDQSQVFARYIGKDTWIKVYSYNDEEDYYVNICSREDNNYICNIMEAATVEGYDDYYEDELWDSILHDLNAKIDIPVNSFSLITPIEAYSYEEIVELIRTHWEAAGGEED